MGTFLDGRCCILWALLLLTVPLPWVISALAAAMFHELCHIVALILMGAKIHSIHIGIRGAAIVTGPLPLKKELFCAAAGPAGSLFLLLFLRHIPRIALCAGFQGLYNLLPIYPLDGGRILRCAVGLLMPVGKREKFLAKMGKSLYNSATIVNEVVL